MIDARSSRWSTGKRSNSRSVRSRYGEVELRDRPARRALVDGHVPDLGLDGGDDLDRAAAAADHRHAPAGEVDVMAPARRVEGRALEVVEPRQRRHARRRELAAGGDQHVGHARRRRLRCQRSPSQRAAVTSTPVRTPQRAAAHDVLEVGLDLGLRGVAPRPARVGLERELVQVRSDVAGRARIACCDARRRRRARRARTPSRRRSPRGAAWPPRRRRRSLLRPPRPSEQARLDLSRRARGARASRCGTPRAGRAARRAA